MKTIKFLQFVKYPVLIFIAFFGIFIGGTQSPPRQLTEAHIEDIGGSQTAPRSFAIISTDEIGGTQTAPRQPIVGNVEIGGQTAPRNGVIASGIDIGGNQGTPRTSFKFLEVDAAKCSFYDFSEYHNIYEIGGQTTPGSENRNFAKSCDCAIGGCLSVQKPNDIGGGQTAPRQLADIGGNQTPPRSLEIGGQTVPSGRPLAFVAAIGSQGNQAMPRI